MVHQVLLMSVTSSPVYSSDADERELVAALRLNVLVLALVTAGMVLVLRVRSSVTVVCNYSLLKGSARTIRPNVPGKLA